MVGSLLGPLFWEIPMWGYRLSYGVLQGSGIHTRSDTSICVCICLEFVQSMVLSWVPGLYKYMYMLYTYLSLCVAVISQKYSFHQNIIAALKPLPFLEEVIIRLHASLKSPRGPLGCPVQDAGAACIAQGLELLMVQGRKACDFRGF